MRWCFKSSEEDAKLSKYKKIKKKKKHAPLREEPGIRKAGEGAGSTEQGYGDTGEGENIGQKRLQAELEISSTVSSH